MTDSLSQTLRILGWVILVFGAATGFGLFIGSETATCDRSPMLGTLHCTNAINWSLRVWGVAAALGAAVSCVTLLWMAAVADMLRRITSPPPQAAIPESPPTADYQG